jgi:hypothetical protein
VSESLDSTAEVAIRVPDVDTCKCLKRPRVGHTIALLKALSVGTAHIQADVHRIGHEMPLLNSRSAPPYR